MAEQLLKPSVWKVKGKGKGKAEGQFYFIERAAEALQ